MNPNFKSTSQLDKLPVDCAGELFKPSKDSASLQVCTEKEILFWISFFVGDVISGVGLNHFDPLNWALGPNQ